MQPNVGYRGVTRSGGSFGKTDELGGVAMRLPIAMISQDGGTQPRAVLDSGVIAEYAEAMKNGASFPSIIVFHDGSQYWLADGFHRVRAAEMAGLSEIEADVHQGTIADAQWHSYGVNQLHGLRRTNEDKQRAVRAALEHPKSAGLSDRQIAKHVGVGHSTVSEWRDRLSVQSGQMQPARTAERTAERNGKQYQINTANIGRNGIARSTDAAVAQPEAQPFCERRVEGSNPSGGSIIPAIDRKRVWAAQETRAFTREIIRLLRSYEKAHPPVSAIIVARVSGAPTSIEIVFAEEGVA